MFKHLSLPFAAALAIAAAPASAQQSNLGGGFIEFLVTGNAGGGARYAPQPQQPAPRAAPAYYPSANGNSYSGPSHAAAPAVSAARPDAGVMQRALPRPSYATAPDAVPPGLEQAVPARPARQQRSTELAYAPMPRVHGLEGKYEKQLVDYDRGHAAGTIVIDTPNKFLYLVQGDGKAMRYGIGVGRPGFEWAGVKHITRKAEWPSWTPPKEMLKRRPDLPRFMEGGEENPLGARALYLGSSLYRIHGTNEPSTIGQAVSSGCIRMRNQDVIDLYGRVRVGTKVVVI